jgi:uncharacterized protein YkwD
MQKLLLTGLLLTLTLPVCAADSMEHSALSAHNIFRQQHGSPKLVWDDKLASYAQRYADKCRFAHSGSPYGENLAAGYPTVTAGVEIWYAERKHYSYQKPGFSMQTGHFTQLVWKGSTKLGCGYASCNGKNGTPGNYLVCEYSPRGNITNPQYFEANVLPRA